LGSRKDNWLIKTHSTSPQVSLREQVEEEDPGGTGKPCRFTWRTDVKRK